MKWNRNAEEALARAPFFVRKRVRKKVEEKAISQGAREVDLLHVKSCQQEFLKNMEKEVRGFQVEQCFGSNGCPNQAVKNEELATEIEGLLTRKNLREFLEKRVVGPLRLHHQFRISISDCPNACSGPQIVDIGIIGSRRPTVDREPCSRCGGCVEICREQAIDLANDQDFPVLTQDNCVGCGQCIDTCPTHTLREIQEGYRVLLGGKLGRHPQLGTELHGVYSTDEIITIVNHCLDHYCKHNLNGERFGEILNRKPMKIEIS